MKFYRINVSGRKFFISENNIFSDFPNIFTERFTSHKNSTRMAVDRDPEVFSRIARYLQGYVIDISLLNKEECYNFLQDAKYYKLNELTKLLTIAL